MMDCIVIGGGISGLMCAERLNRAGVSVLLLERAGRFGGVMQTVRQDGFQFELGPQSFLSNDTLLEAVHTLGIQKDFQQANARAPRFIFFGGRLVAAPMAPPQLIASPLLGAATKLRLFSEPFRRSEPPESDESVADFVRRKFGNDLLDNMVGPLVSGIHAGDPEKLSARSAFPFLYDWEKKYGSVLKGAMKSRPPKDRPRPTLSSFSSGVEAVARALASTLGDSVQAGMEVQQVRHAKANGSTSNEVVVTSGGRHEIIAARAVVIATPSANAAAMLRGLSAAAAELLSGIEYAPVAVVGAGYRKQDVTAPLDGFGFLVPRKEGLRILGTVWASSLFPGRAPEMMANFATFIGGATDRAFDQLSDDDLAAIAEQENARVLGIRAAPVSRVLKRWPEALPQYNLGHGRRMEALRAALGRLPGIFLAGNYLNGPSIGNCAEQAVRTAEAVQRYLLDEQKH